MGLEDGDDAVLDNYYPFQQYNRIKNHWRQSDPIANISNPQDGMIVSDEDDDKLYHKVSDSVAYDEVLQETLSNDTTPIFGNLILSQQGGSLSDPPLKAELNTVFGVADPADLGEGWIGFAYDTDSGAEQIWLVQVYNSEYWHQKMTKAL